MVLICDGIIDIIYTYRCDMSIGATDCGPKALGPPSPVAAKLPLAPRFD